MLTILDWLIENYESFIVMGVLIVLLGLSGNLTVSIQKAKKGLTEAMTPLGFITLCGLAYLVYKIYLSIMETL